MPQQHQGGLVLRGCSGSVVEVGQRGGRDVGERAGGEQDQTQDAQGGSDECWRRVRPTQRAVQGEGVDDPQEEDHEVQAVLHRACRPDVGELRERLLKE